MGRIKPLTRFITLSLIFTSSFSYNVNEIVKSNSDKSAFLDSLNDAGVTKAKHVQKWIKNWEKYWNHVQKVADKAENQAEKVSANEQNIEDAQNVHAREVAQNEANIEKAQAQKQNWDDAKAEKEARASQKIKSQQDSTSNKQADAQAKAQMIADRISQKQANKQAKDQKTQAKQQAISDKKQAKAASFQKKSDINSEKAFQRAENAQEKEEIKQNKIDLHEKNKARKESNADAKEKRAKKMMRVKFAKQLRKDAGFPGVMSYTGCVPDNSIVSFEHTRSAPIYDGGMESTIGTVSVSAPEECRGLWYVMVGHSSEIGGIESIDSIHEVNAVKNKFNNYNWHRLTPFSSQWGSGQSDLSIQVNSDQDPANFKYYYCCQGDDEVEEWLGAQELPEPAEDCSAADSSLVQWTSSQDFDFAFRKKRRRRQVEQVDESFVYGSLTVNVADWGVVDNAYFVARGNPFSQITSLVVKLHNDETLTDCNVIGLGNDVWKVEFPAGTSSIGGDNFKLLAKIGGAGSDGNYVSWYWCEGM